MELTCQEVNHIRVLAVHGRIDQANTETFQQALTPHLNECKEGGISIVLDLSNVEYVSSIGLRALMLAARAVKTQKGKIVLSSLTPIVSEVFRISRFNMLFDIFDNSDLAITELSK